MPCLGGVTSFCASIAIHVCFAFWRCLTLLCFYTCVFLRILCWDLRYFEVWVWSCHGNIWEHRDKIWDSGGCPVANPYLDSAWTFGGRTLAFGHFEAVVCLNITSNISHPRNGWRLWKESRRLVSALSCDNGTVSFPFFGMGAKSFHPPAALPGPRGGQHTRCGESSTQRLCSSF